MNCILLAIIISQLTKRMKTRSQTKKESKFREVNIDFDEASNAWNKNKKSIGNGHYKYVCLHEKHCGIKCGKVCYKDLSCCWSHRNKKST